MVRVRHGYVLFFAAFVVVLFYFSVKVLAPTREKWMKKVRNGKLHEQKVDNDLNRQKVLLNLDARKNEWQKYMNMSAAKPKSKRLPDFVGIGVEKCGTTAIIKFLAFHPLIKIPNTLEGEAHFFDHKYEKGLDHYRNMMPQAADHEFIMEKSPAYFDSPPSVIPDRIHKDLPNVKLIAVVCEPVKRCYSDYAHEKIFFERHHIGVNPEKYPTFDSYLDSYLDRANASLTGSYEKVFEKHMKQYYNDYSSTVLTTGVYSVYLRRWMNLFDSDKLLILNGEDLLDNIGSQMEKIQEFFKIPKLLLASDFVRSPETGLFCLRPWWTDYNYEREWNDEPGWGEQLRCLASTKGRTRHSSGSMNVSEKHLASLKDLYRPFNKELNQMTGIKFQNE